MPVEKRVKFETAQPANAQTSEGPAHAQETAACRRPQRSRAARTGMAKRGNDAVLLKNAFQVLVSDEESDLAAADELVKQRLLCAKNKSKSICGKHERNFCSAFSECCKSAPEVWGDIGFPTDELLSETSLAPIFLANLEDPKLMEKVNRIKLKCENERKEAEAESNAGSEVKSLLTQMMGAVNYGSDKPRNDWSTWKQIAIAIDSGAAEIVIPHTLVTEYAISQTDKSRAGVCYASATGEPIPNLGEQKLPLATVEGSLRAMTFQVAPVSKPLGSVKRICAAGHRVVFDDDGSYIVNKLTGELNWLRDDNGNFMLDVWVPPPTAIDPYMNGNGESPFQRQP